MNIQINNKVKYCKECASDIDRKKTRERMRKIRMFEANKSEIR